MSAAADHDASEWRDLNHAWWDERAPIHVESLFYRSGGGGLEDFEREDIGPVDGLSVVHPQCHIGTDMISLAKGGASTVGMDFSAAAIEGAARLAEHNGVGERTEWLVSDVYDSTAAVGGREFDLVYTGMGALCWLPDMDRWAAQMWALCRPGGHLYISEFHPMQDQLHDDDTRFERSYFPTGGDLFDEPGSYADKEATTAENVIVDFIHPVSEVVTALLAVGFVLRLFREFPFTAYARWPWLEEREEGLWYMPDDRPDIPLMYSLLLDRPS
ncbi:MAG: methyltransferase domain-containing protein [Acidimicrobiales bacterium]|nr:methyltransferase domain-containing protein [Acidimicrobiales bacterium]